MHIGLLEDNPRLCVMVQRMLEIRGHTACIYHDGMALLSALPQEEPTDSLPPFDLLLVDLILPGPLSGEQVIGRMRKKYPTLPMVILSATGSSHLEEVLKSHPGVKALRKPFTVHHLFAALEGEESFP